MVPRDNRRRTSDDDRFTLGCDPRLGWCHSRLGPPQHRESWERLANEAGHQLPEGYFARAFGKKGDAIVTDVLGWVTDRQEAATLAARKEKLYREILAARRVDPLPGVFVFLSVLQKAGLPVAIASSTERANIDAVLPRLALPNLWRAIVCAEDVSRGKPDPQVFLKAAALLGRDARMCVVVEDSMSEFDAARNAGMKLIGVATTHALPDIAAHSDLAVRQLGDVSLDDVQQLFSS